MFRYSFKILLAATEVQSQHFGIWPLSVKGSLTMVSTSSVKHKIISAVVFQEWIASLGKYLD